MARLSNFRLRLPGSAEKREGLIALASFVIDGERLVEGVEVHRSSSGFSIVWRNGTRGLGEGPVDESIEVAVVSEVLGRLGPLLFGEPL